MTDRGPVTLFDAATPEALGDSATPEALFDGEPGALAEPTRSAPKPARRVRRFALSNWPVRGKVLAIALVPLLLAMVFGGLRIYDSAEKARELRLAAQRAELVPAITDYLTALETAMVSGLAPGDPATTAAAAADFEGRREALDKLVKSVDVTTEVRDAVNELLESGQGFLAAASAGQLSLRQSVTAFAPLLLTAENAITASARVNDEKIRAEAEGLSRAVGARGLMAMQSVLLQRGGELPEPELRSSMTALAGTEPSSVMGMGALLGSATADAATLRNEMVQRLSMMSDPAVPLVGNEALAASFRATDDIAKKLIDSTAPRIVSAVRAEADVQRNNAIRDAAVVAGVLLLGLLVVWLVARSLTRPLRRLRDGALKIAHEDLAAEIGRVKLGDEREPDPLPIHTTEEVGQVAHAVDELHAQALLLAGDEARLRVMVNDMFETLSRRNKSLVDQQLSLIERLERNEADPERLESLFKLDHLATRMRRNGANLLVLAGTPQSRDRAAPVSLSALVNAAASEVEEYQRVETGAVPDSAVLGSVAVDCVHLLAELIDNALRYSPPQSPVRVSAVRGADGVLIEVADEGLGMSDSDLRIANMRLQAGGEVSPDSTRHMGLFVVGRLAGQHGMGVQLFPGIGTGVGTGIIAQVLVPPTLLDGHSSAPEPRQVQQIPEPAPENAWAPQPEFEPAPEFEPEPDAAAGGLPRRDPGSSGIAGATLGSGAPAPGEQLAAPSNTAGFFGSQRRLRDRTGPAEQAEVAEVAETDSGAIDLSDMDRLAEELAPHPDPADVDTIYQNMVSEWLDPKEVQQLAVPQEWQSVWDNGWAAAEEAQSAPVEQHTDHGLPVRAPGIRLVPGGAADVAGQVDHGSETPRDPEAVRSSMSSHFGGVRAARSRSELDNQDNQQSRTHQS